MPSEQEEGDAADLGFGLGDLLSQVQNMQDRLAAAQAEAAEMLVEARAGGGKVVVQVTGGLEFRSIKIDPDFFAEADVTLVEDMVLAAVRGVMEQVSDLNRKAIEDSGLGGFDDALDFDSMLGGLGGIGLQAAAGGEGETSADEGEDPAEAGD
jgi:DNA-binding YbaB/EbfC family protein